MVGSGGGRQSQRTRACARGGGSCALHSLLGGLQPRSASRALPALDVVGAEFVRTVEPGELVIVRGGELRSIRPFAPIAPRPCIFEWVYFSRPDSIVDEQSIYSVRKNIGDIIAHVASKDQVTVAIDDDRPHMVGHNLRAYIEELEKRMRKAAADLEFEEAGRLRDEIRQLEQEELGLPVEQQKAPLMGRSNEGKPGTRKTRYGKVQRKFGGRGAR